MKMMPHKKIGFTLLEVLVALVILAVAITAVMMVMRNSIHDTFSVKNKITAHWVAMNTLSKMKLGLLSQPKMGDSVTGATKSLGKNWRWRAHVSQAGSQYYERIDVDVYSANDSQRVGEVIGFQKIH